MKGSTKKYLKAWTNLALAVVLLATVVLLLPKCIVFFMPFIVGWIVAWIAGPVVRFLEEKLRIKRKASSVVVIVIVIALVVLALYAVIMKLITEGMNLMNDLPVMWQGAQEDFREIADRFSVLYEKLPETVQDTLSGIKEQANVYIGGVVEQISSPTLAAIGNFAKQLPSVLIAVIMGLLSAYFFVTDREWFVAKVKTICPPAVLAKYDVIKRSVMRSIGGYLKAQIKIEVWIYLIVGVGLTILKVRYAFLIAIGIALLDILPFLGTAIVLYPWAAVKLLSGDYHVAIGLLIIWGISQLVRHIIQPKIVGDSVGVPPIPTLLLLYTGYKVGSVIGMIIAVPLGLVVYTMYEEGAFDTVIKSIKILVHGINDFRKITESDMEESNGKRNEGRDE